MLELLRRLAGSLRGSRTDADLEQELRVHVEMASAEEQSRGHHPAEAARLARLRAGDVELAMDTLRDQRGVPWLASARADLVFAWRQVIRHRVASLAVILSLGLAMGATLAAYRLVDAVLRRPLHVADPSQLFFVTRTVQAVDLSPDDRDDFDYPTYRTYVALTTGQADLMLVGMTSRRSITFDGGDPETAVQQFVSGNVFATLGLRPAVGRLLSEQDDVVPGGHPVVVLSHDYWQRRFASDPAVVGRTFRMDGGLYEITGVAAKGFTGTEPGAVTDFFVPAMMNPEALKISGWSWFRIWLRPRPGVDPRQVEALLHSRFQAEHIERARSFAPDTPRSRVEAFLTERLVLQPAGAGASVIQKTFRRPLWILASLATLLLLIACGNVANLQITRALARRGELALRLSLGATRGRLLQLMLFESALLATLACGAGALFAWWAAPFIVSMLAPAERPVRLILDLDVRAVAIGVSLIVAVTMIFGLAHALRASATTPAGALKEIRGLHGHRRLTSTLVAVQMALCVFLLMGASLFVGSLDRLQSRPLGFAPEQLLHVVVDSRRQLPPEEWGQLAAALTDLPRIESAIVAGWAPLSGNRWRSSVTAPGVASPQDAPNWVSVSPGYFATMRIAMLQGREFRAGDRPPRLDEAKKPVAGVAVVNEAFARVYFGGGNPVGRRVVVDSSEAPMQIVGLATDAVYFSVREASHPAVYVPLAARQGATLLVRTSGSGTDRAQALRRELARLAPDVQLREAVTFESFLTQQLIRERLLAALSTFFAALAVILAVIGIYGVLNHAVTRERREIGLRIVLGARPAHIVLRLTARLLGAMSAGAIIGLAGGVAFGRWVQALLFETDPADPAALFVPLTLMAVAAVFAVLPPAIRAVRTDPARVIVTQD
ncbi:MAG TPA: ADOP family duplicated permease [Vicinamibacterales bacterium]|nr:ADOP family duplicated permease [Vicinamibacterales bacterium]